MCNWDVSDSRRSFASKVQTQLLSKYFIWEVGEVKLAIYNVSIHNYCILYMKISQLSVNIWKRAKVEIQGKVCDFYPDLPDVLIVWKFKPCSISDWFMSTSISYLLIANMVSSSFSISPMSSISPSVSTSEGLPYTTTHPYNIHVYYMIECLIQCSKQHPSNWQFFGYFVSLSGQKINCICLDKLSSLLYI